MPESAALQTEREQLLAENELVHARLAELFANNEEYDRQIAETQRDRAAERHPQADLPLADLEAAPLAGPDAGAALSGALAR